MPVMPYEVAMRRASLNATAMHSIGNQIQYRVHTLAHYGQPAIDIELDDSGLEASRFVTSYSTMDTIKGNVHITSQHDAKFDEIAITFIGTSQVFVERLTTTPSMSGCTEAAHQFLNLKMPLDPASMPSPRVFKAGKKYTFPFVFAVPAQLLPKSCPHAVDSDYVREMHLMLPPSLGDPDLAGFGGTLLDDMAPQMSKVTYGVKVRIMQSHDGDHKPTILSQKTKKVRVKPAFEEEPPLNLDGNKAYRPRLERPIKKALFKGKVGTLVAQASQPKPLVIPGARTTDTKPISTRAKIILRFDPADEECLPPKLGSLKTSIKVSTFYACSPRPNFPSRDHLIFDRTQGAYTDGIPISTMSIGTSLYWTKHPASASPPPLAPSSSDTPASAAAPPSTVADDDPTRRDSGISDCSTTSHTNPHDAIPAPSSAYQNTSFYTASITVPITMPLNKNFLPTFHSCLISRSYAVSMSLGVGGLGAKALSVKVPVQVCAEGSVEGRQRLGSMISMGMNQRADAGAGGMAQAGEVDGPPGYVESGFEMRGRGTRASV